MSIWEGDQEVVNSSGRDELIHIVIYLYMEAMLVISLFSYPYLNLQKCFVLLIIAYVYLQLNWRKGQNRSCLEARWVGGGRG
jgi:hypothetical protein